MASEWMKTAVHTEPSYPLHSLSNILQSMGSSGNVFLSAFPADRIRQPDTHERGEEPKKGGGKAAKRLWMNEEAFLYL